MSPSSPPAPSSPMPRAPATRPPAAAAGVPKFRPRACARCSLSKLKCTWLSEPGEAPCERCARTKAECVLPNLKPRGPRRGNPTRVGQLEQKLDGIMSLLTASQQIKEARPAEPASLSHSPDPARSQSFTASAPPATPGSPGSPGDLSSFMPPIASVTPGGSLQLPPLQGLTMAAPPPPLEHVEVAPGLRITFGEAELALAEYRARYSPCFPFVPATEFGSAYGLFQQQPLLFRVLMQVALPQPPQMQRDARRWFREQLAQRLLVDDERDLGLLQALLLSLAWSDFGYYIDPKHTPLIQLAVGLVTDLGLHKSPKGRNSLPKPIAEAACAMRGPRHHVPGHPRPEHGLPEMRAALGCYYICSISTSLFRRTLPFPFTSYLAECCDRLRSTRELASDLFLVALIDLQRIAGRIHATLPNPDGDPVTTLAGPLYMSFASLRRSLDAFAQAVPDELKNNYFIWTHYHAIVMRLYESAIYVRLPPAPPDPLDPAHLAECLWNGLQATRAFFDAILAIPASELGVLPFTTTAHLSFGVVTITRLLFLDDPVWDLPQARRALDFAGLATRLEDRFRAAEEWDNQQIVALAAAHSQGGGTTRFAHKTRYVASGAAADNRPALAMYRDKMRWIRTWCAAKMPSDDRPGSAAGPTLWETATALGTPAALPDSLMDLDLMDVQSDDFDSSFWKVIFSLDGSWDGQI